MRLLMITDAQHGPKTGRRGRRLDPGAQADLDHDGRIVASEQEWTLVRRYAELLGERVAGWAAWRPVPESCTAEDYSDGHQWASEQAAAWDGPSVYLACHLNSSASPSPVRTALVGYYAQSAGSMTLAQQLARALAAGIPDLVDTARAVPVAPDSREAWRRRMHWTIRGAGVVRRGGRLLPVPRMVAACLEPCDLRSLPADEAARDEALGRIAAALDAGLRAWAGGRVA